MATVHRHQLEEWLHLDLDGELPERHRRDFERELEADPQLAAERDQLGSLDQLLAAQRIEVRDGFAEQITARLPVASWEARNRRAWKLPLALLVTFAAAAAALAALAPATSGGNLVVSLVEMTGTALLTGAGLLGASWTGLRLAFIELVSTSTTGVVGLVVVLVALNALLVTLLRRRERAVTAASHSDTGRSARS